MTGILRTPTAQVLAGGSLIPFTECKVTQTRTRTGDTFSLKTAISAVDLNYFLDTTPIPITITINGVQLFTGNVDHVDVDFTTREFSISGRDKAAALLDSQTSEKFLNQTPTQIVQALAARHGLSVDADTPNGDAGKMYSSDFDAITHRGSEWSMIGKLADHYGMIAYITNGTLYFKNYNETYPPYPIYYTPPTASTYETGNFIDLKATRTMIVGRPIKVNVNSHNHRRKQVTTTAATSSAGQGEPLIYNHTIPGITQDQAQTIANAKLAEIQRHELTLSGLSFPGDETVNARMSFVLSGTGTILDQSYDANSIDHDISVKGGYRTSITVKSKKKGH